MFGGTCLPAVTNTAHINYKLHIHTQTHTQSWATEKAKQLKGHASLSKGPEVCFQAPM